jgi:hypothetical protein
MKMGCPVCSFAGQKSIDLTDLCTEHSKKQAVPLLIAVKLPIKTVSEANTSEHWTISAKRHKTQKKQIAWWWISLEDKPSLPCSVKLTRIAPRMLDSEDNLPISFKWVKDYIADKLVPGLKAGRADDSKDITWLYDQQKGMPKEYAVIIEIHQNR